MYTCGSNMNILILLSAFLGLTTSIHAAPRPGPGEPIVNVGQLRRAHAISSPIFATDFRGPIPLTSNANLKQFRAHQLKPMANYNGEPIVNYKGEPIVNYNGEPIVNFSGEPIVNYNGEPIVNYSGEPIVNYNGEPIVNYNGEPIVN
ncbi:uncharacterized protein LOC131876821 [Tigriopus californicus]|uniref:uncharacterized protein LOC131876821 n=1 Tax=Tigriopus californicus TaxID=6832 RepID=UPI0027DA2994|nr:uncharacterized protein LOC131876821 [Tigriopus californicus]